MLEHPLHVAVLLEQTVNVFHLHPAAGRNAALPGGIDQIRLFALRRRHGQNYGLRAIKLPLVDLHIIQLLAYTGKHRKHLFEIAHFLHLTQLIEQIIEVEFILPKLGLKLHRLFLIKRRLCLLDQR